eukprot:TRINITY_DN12812_c0_g1_i1.p1 TRINITY_DN12812_c0_g1~~TRINITY_DN12812_c0_g1_i1.p1  ORF type:complete len:656 (+),score=152.34 TRINITY_DN12812_c0_g1_i1:350-2317(+)
MSNNRYSDDALTSSGPRTHHSTPAFSTQSVKIQRRSGSEAQVVGSQSGKTARVSSRSTASTSSSTSPRVSGNFGNLGSSGGSSGDSSSLSQVTQAASWSRHTATSMPVMVLGGPQSNRGRFLSSFLGPLPELTDARPLGFQNTKHVTMGQISYVLELHTTLGLDDWFGLHDTAYSKARAFIYVYNLNDRTTLDNFDAVWDHILRVKEGEHVPVLLLGYTGDGLGDETREISSMEGKRMAEAHGCHHQEILTYDPDETNQCVMDFLQTIVAYHSRVRETAGIGDLTVMACGDLFVGKTALIHQLITNSFSLKYHMTNDYTMHKYKLTHESSQTNISLIDSPGVVAALGRGEYPKELLATVQGILLIYSITSRQSFEMVVKIRDLILAAKNEGKVPMVLIGNKVDEEDYLRQVSFDEGKHLATALGCSFVEVSVKRKDAARAVEALVDEISGQLHKAEEDLVAFRRMDKTSTLMYGKGKKAKPKTVTLKNANLLVDNKNYSLVGVTSVAEDTAGGRFPFVLRLDSGKLLNFASSSERERTDWLQTVMANSALCDTAENLLNELLRVMIWEQGQALLAQQNKVRGISGGKMVSVNSSTFTRGSVEYESSARRTTSSSSMTAPPMSPPAKSKKKASSFKVSGKFKLQSLQKDKKKDKKK